MQSALTERKQRRAGVEAVLLIGALFLFPVAAQPTCVGDCDGDGFVAIEEVVTLVRVLLGESSLGLCVGADANEDGTVDVAEIVKAVRSLWRAVRPVAATGSSKKANNATMVAFASVPLMLGAHAKATRTASPQSINGEGSAGEAKDRTLHAMATATAPWAVVWRVGRSVGMAAPQTVRENTPCPSSSKLPRAVTRPREATCPFSRSAICSSRSQSGYAVL